MKGRLVALLVAVLVGLTISTGYTADTTVRWDLVSVDFTASPVTVSAGGSAAALANDGSLIKLTGSGTFVAPDDGGGTADAILTQFLSLLRRKTFEASWWRTALAGATAYVAQTGEPLPRRGAA